MGELPDSDTSDPNLRQGRIALAGGDGVAVYQWGAYEPATGEAPRVRLNLNPPLDSWNLLYFAPTATASPFGGSMFLNLAAGLGALVLALVGLAAYFYRESTRDMREAAERVSFVNQVSHELKTPLTTSGCMQNCLSKAFPKGTATLPAIWTSSFRRVSASAA